MKRVQMAPRAYLVAIAAMLTAVTVTGCTGSPAQQPPAAEQASEQVAESSKLRNLAPGFSYVDEASPGVLIDARYGTASNFTGEIIDGYVGSDIAILRDDAAQALAGVQRDLAREGMGLLVWDAFRPTRAVDHFVSWSKTPDDVTKDEFYPDHEKSELFELGYIAKESRHSLGGTVDLTIVDAESGVPLDMGGEFDFFGERSHYEAAGLTAPQRANRERLRTAMEVHGFEPYALEWWHFTYPLPETTRPADFPVA